MILIQFTRLGPGPGTPGPAAVTLVTAPGPRLGLGPRPGSESLIGPHQIFSQAGSVVSLSD